MGVFPFGRKKTEEVGRLSALLELAQAGNVDARNDLIKSYTPFVMRIASQAAGRYIDKSRDDEFSVALLAFNEAIDKFDIARKVHFLGFAETIIRRRLIDHFRAQKSRSRFVPWSDFDIVDDEDNVINYVEVRASIEDHSSAEQQTERLAEIQEFSLALQSFGISFNELVETSPKHADARRNAMDVARIVAGDEDMIRYVRERKALPLKALEAKAGVSRKTMERQRKYILALVILLLGDYQQLQGYIS